MIFTWGGMGFQNVFGDRPTKWPIAKKQKQTQQNICALGSSQLIKLINMNHNKYNKYLTIYKNYNEEYSIINVLLKQWGGTKCAFKVFIGIKPS